MRVKVITTDGETRHVECMGVPKSDITASYIDDRTGFDVDSIEIDDPDYDLEQAISDASNLSELKDALTGGSETSRARVRGRPKR